MFVDFICTVPFLADKGCPQNEYEQNEYVCCWLCYNFFVFFVSLIKQQDTFFLTETTGKPSHSKKRLSGGFVFYFRGLQLFQAFLHPVGRRIEDGEQLAFLAGDANLAIRDFAVIHNFACLRIDPSRLHVAHVRHVGGDGHRHLPVAVHSCGKSQVCQREERTALTIASGVEMLRRNKHTGLGIALRDFHQFGPDHCGKPVVHEKFF